jgi:hypothetical protein
MHAEHSRRKNHIFASEAFGGMSSLYSGRISPCSNRDFEAQVRSWTMHAGCARRNVTSVFVRCFGRTTSLIQRESPVSCSNRDFEAQMLFDPLQDHARGMFTWTSLGVSSKV